jgi:hypothetical protein
MHKYQDELHDSHGSEVFATLEFCQGYWQIPLHKDSQDCQSFITPDGVYTPTRVLHETRKATQHLQFHKTVNLSSRQMECNTDTYTTNNDKCYAASAVYARRHDGQHQEQHQSMVGRLSTSYEDGR